MTDYTHTQAHIYLSIYISINNIYILGGANKYEIKIKMGPFFAHFLSCETA